MAASTLVIRVTYKTIDRICLTRKFKTLRGARAFAHKWVGARPEMGSFYAVSGDGVGRITVTGCLLQELFPEAG